MLTTATITTVVSAALHEDAPWGDITSELLIPAEAMATAELVAREHGVFSGGAVFRAAFALTDPSVTVELLVADAAPFAAGDVLARVSGSARVILQADPDLAIRNRFGGVSHIPASERGHADYVAFVLDETDIAIDHVNDLGWTALLEAVILGRGTKPWQRIVESLVEHGADVSIADRDNVTASQHARRLGFTDIASILDRAPT